jgi:hypothetical protein
VHSSAVLSALTFAGFVLWLLPVQAQSLRYLGQQVLPHDHAYAGTTVGGLSAIDYDANTQRFIVLFDDRSERQPARFYTLELDLDRFTVAPEPGHDGVGFVGMTYLRDDTGSTYPRGSIDPEAIRLFPRTGSVLWASEGDVRRGIPPVIEEANPDGRSLRRLELPAYFLPAPQQGVRDNLAFESLAVDVDRDRIYVGLENALWQDGPTSDLKHGSPSRILVYAASTGERLGEYVYEVDPVPGEPPLPFLYRTNGLVELLADEGVLLALERSYIQGIGSGARIYRLDFSAASDVSSLSALAGTHYRPVGKKLVLDLGMLAIPLDNVEGMSWGPRLHDGGRSLILVSDNNFSASQRTQFLLFECFPQ